MAGRYPIPAVAGPHRVQVEVRRSRFITSLGHAADVPGARAFIESIRREFPDAGIYYRLYGKSNQAAGLFRISEWSCIPWLVS